MPIQAPIVEELQKLSKLINPARRMHFKVNKDEESSGPAA